MVVTYRSDFDADFQCLERYLTAGEFGDLPDARYHQAQHDLASLNKIYEAIAASASWISEDMREKLPAFLEIELPTKYDSPPNFRLISDLIDKLKSAAERIGLDVAEFPYYSSIPTGKVNACAVELPCSSRPFLLFDSKLLLYCHLFSKAFARCLPVVKTDGALSFSLDLEKVRERIEGKNDVISKLFDVLDSYVRTDDPSNAEPYHLESDYVQMSTIIRDGMELFVVAHEFGHVYAGHLGELLLNTRLNAIDWADGNASHQQEYEADSFGLILTLHAMNEQGYDVGLSYIGIDLFFISLDMVDRYTHFVKGYPDREFRSSSSASHPSNQSRRQILSKSLEHFVGQADQVNAARELASKYADIASYLWTEVQRMANRQSV